MLLACGLAAMVLLQIETLTAALVGLALLALGLWLNLAATARRLHDLGFSAWWLFAANIPTFAFVWIAESGALDGARAGLKVLEWTIDLTYLGFIILLGALRGRMGQNKFDWEPRASAA